jgi:predicted nucleic acid-binding protein
MMRQEIVIDTDVLINCLRGSATTLNFLKELAQSNMLSCSAITVAEIFAGMKDTELRMTEMLIDGLNIINVDRKIAQKAGNYRQTIKSQNLQLDDCIIAATCFVKKAALVTANVKHYPMKDIEKIDMKEK